MTTAGVIFIAARGLEAPGAWSLEVFAGLLAREGLTDGATRLWGASEQLLDSVGGSLAPSIGWSGIAILRG
jgi:hypothetical protein